MKILSALLIVGLLASACMKSEEKTETAAPAATTEQAAPPAEQAPAEQAPAEQAPAEQAPAEQH
ncbi:MAG: hypothetical protein HYV97_09660 [Bdellovibrio sp.]|nr:hypothetical protein [Bdellovibrio sp.]